MDLVVRAMVPSDIADIVALQDLVYPPTLAPWNKSTLAEQLNHFPQGQVVVESQGRVVGYAGSLIVLWDDWCEFHTWEQITTQGTFRNHNPLGRTLYGAEIFVDPALRGAGIGRLLYEARRQVCRAFNLKRIIACGRLPGYAAHSGSMSAEMYAKRVVWGDFTDPVLTFQLREGFSYCGVVNGYLAGDEDSQGYASIIVWLNPEYDSEQPTLSIQEVPL